MAEIASFGVNVDQNTRLAQNAQDTANTANGGVNNINDPNKLAPAEKATLKRKYDTDVLLYGMDTKKLTDNQLSTSEIDSAMSALTAYMTPLFANMTTTDTVDRDTLNTVYKNFDTADKNADSAFTNMVSNTASDALSAGNQAKKVGSEAIAAGNQASEAASNAAVQASVAVSNANMAQSSVATAITKAGFASDTASAASQAAGDAKNIASQAANNVAIAKNDAANALTSALNAQSYASDAVKQASSAATDSKDAKQIAGAVSQSYKTLTDGSTMTIAELESGLAAKLTKTDLDGYATQVWTQNKIKVTADDISGNLSSVKKTVDGQTTSINDLKADSSSFKSRFTTVNNTLGKHTTDIGTLQATSKELTSGFNTLTTDNTTNKNDISQLKQTATELNSTMTTVQTQVQNSAVGTNLMLGTTSSEKSYTGDFSTVPSWGDHYVSQVAVNAGSTYTYSIYLTKLTGSFVLGYWGYDSNEKYARWVPSGANSSLGKVSWTFKVPSGISYVVPHVHASDDFACTAKEEKLELGSHATDWCLNPTETATVTAVSKLSQTVDGVKSDISKKIEQKDLNGYATRTWAQNKINATADGISGTISSIKTTVDGHTTSINDLKADSSSFKSQFTTVNNTLGKQKTDIGNLQATSKELTSGFNTLTTDNNTNKNDISELKQTSSELSNTMETVKTQVQNSAVGTNLLLKTGTAFSMTGNNKVNQVGSAYSLANGYNVSSLASALGTQVTISFDWSVAGDSPSGKFHTQWNNVPWGMDLAVTVSNSNASGHVSHTFSVSTDSKNVGNGLDIRLDNFVGSITISNVKLEKGSLATDWCPNPADNATVTALTQVKQTAEGASQLSKDNHGNILALQSTAKGLQTTVRNNYSDLKSQVTQTDSAWRVALSNTGQVNLVYNSGYKNNGDGWNTLGRGYFSTVPVSMYEDSPGFGVSYSGRGNTWTEFGESKHLSLPTTTVDATNVMSFAGYIKLYAETAGGIGAQLCLAFYDTNGARVTGYSGYTLNYTDTGGDQAWHYVKKENVPIPANAVTFGIQYWGYGDTVHAMFAHPMIVKASTVGPYVESTSDLATQSDITQSINNIHLGFQNPDGSKFQMNLSADGTALLDFSKIMLKGKTNIANGTIGNAQIANGAINQAKIANAAIGSAQIADLAVTNAKIGNVDAGKITTGILDASHLNVDDVIANVINGKTITGIVVNTPTLNLGLNGTFTESYDYTQATGWFLPKKASGTVTFNHGVIEDQGTMQSYVNGTWGAINDSSIFTSGMTNNVWTEYAPGYYKIDMYKQGSTTNVLQRTYADPTGYYYTEANGNKTYLGNILQTPQVQTTSLFATVLNQMPGQLRMKMVANGSDWGLQVGSYAGNEAVLSDFIYNSTSSHSANLHITTNGHIVRSTSASKYKYNIKHAIDEDSLADKLLTMHISTWNDKHAVDSYAQTLTDNTESEDISIKDNYGLIAEDLRDAGLDMFIEYGKNHTIEGIEYDRAWLPLLPKMRQMNDKINEYELRISKLEAKINE